MADLPVLRGKPIQIAVQGELTVSGGKLHSGLERGIEVSAASYLLERRMVLEAELLQNEIELRRIVVHELFHFVWRRLGNKRRAQWDALIERELAKRARGELGWSAERLKNALSAEDDESKSRRWRQYVCESFCDTASWFFGSGHKEYTLAARHRRKRREWFVGLLADGWLPV